MLCFRLSDHSFSGFQMAPELAPGQQLGHAFVAEGRPSHAPHKAHSHLLDAQTIWTTSHKVSRAGLSNAKVSAETAPFSQEAHLQNPRNLAEPLQKARQKRPCW